jgi:hypothetical protein
MAKSNYERVGEVLQALKDGLAPFVVREMARVFGAGVIGEINQALTSGVYGGLASTTIEGAVRELDAQSCLNLIQRRWAQVFQAKLGNSERGYCNILTDARNNWAHQRPFTNDDAYEAADNARRLLESVGAPQQADICASIARELLRLRFDAEQKQAQKPAQPSMIDAPPTTKSGLSPWRLVVEPHPSVATGEYAKAEFAADLAQVVSGRADPEYKDPKEFFRRTYLTEGLVELLANGLRRLSGKGGDPVIQLQTSFGGGKTHSMLAMYHLFSGEIRLSEIPGGEAIVARVPDIDHHLQAHRAVIVGTAFDPAKPRIYRQCTTHTLWGEIAYQLGGLEGYRLVENADLNGVSPGADTLVELLEQYGPALVIIDELVAFARNIYEAGKLPSGTFEALLTFMQALTEAVKRSSDALLLISIPQSDMEIGGEGGHITLEMLTKTIGRLETIWKPVTANEAYEIVRRRLFSDSLDYASRDAVLNAFRDMYRQNPSEYPSGVSESDYIARMKAAYPIHPELFERLYEDWSTLDRFQRTRGILRFMSGVIHRLWQDNDSGLLIMPCSVPLWTPSVRNEIVRYLPENWPAIVDTDIDGQHSKPYELDKNTPSLMRHSAARRVSRTIFIGSAPSVAAQSVRGLEETRIRLGTVQPGEPSAVFGDALRRMTNQSAYLYSEGTRYWYDTRPTVNRLAQDRAMAIEKEAIIEEQTHLLRATIPSNNIHIAPKSSGDVVDEPRTRWVVLAPHQTHNKTQDSDAMKMARDILENRDNAPRLYRNMLVFIAPDSASQAEWDTVVREYLAWKSIGEDESLNLDAQQRRQVDNNLQQKQRAVKERLQHTYCWLIVPNQPEPLTRVELSASRITFSEDPLHERIRRKLRADELVIDAWSPDFLLQELDKYLWADAAHLSVKKLWEYLASYCYLPRLSNDSVLQKTVKEGASRPDAPFGYATRVDGDGVYHGLKLGQPVTEVYLDGNAVVVRRERAEAQQQAEAPAETPHAHPPSPRGERSASSGEGDTPPTSASPKRKTRYYGTVTLDPERINRDVNAIASEILEHLARHRGVRMSITLEINATLTNGFDEVTQRTVSENSRTLRFDNASFEES